MLASAVLTTSIHSSTEVFTLSLTLSGTWVLPRPPLVLALFGLTLDTQTGLVALQQIDHVVLEVALCSLDHHGEVVLVRELDDLYHFSGVADRVQNVDVLQVAEVYDLLEGLIQNLSLKVYDHLLVLLA